MTGFDFTGGALPAGATLTRASVGTRFNNAGLLVSEAANVARFDHDPVTLAPRGLLIEPARTNLLPSSQNVASGWSISDAAQATSPVAAPNGGQASRVTVAALALGFYKSFGAVTAGETITITAYRRAGAAQTVNIGFSASADAANNVGVGVTDTTTWTRARFTHVVPVNDALFAAPAATIARTGAAAIGTQITVDVALIQVERGAEPSSYIPTTSGVATRAADVLVLDWATKGLSGDAAIVTYTFDDLSTQTRTEPLVAGKSTVPATLDRRHLRSATTMIVLAVTPAHRRVTLVGTGSRSVTITA